jgi:hypothetical protein
MRKRDYLYYASSHAVVGETAETMQHRFHAHYLLIDVVSIFPYEILAAGGAIQMANILRLLRVASIFRFSRYAQCVYLYFEQYFPHVTSAQV